jgi:hypothetical protein
MGAPIRGAIRSFDDSPQTDRHPPFDCRALVACQSVRAFGTSFTKARHRLTTTRCSFPQTRKQVARQRYQVDSRHRRVAPSCCRVLGCGSQFDNDAARLSASIPKFLPLAMATTTRAPSDDRAIRLHTMRRRVVRPTCCPSG